MRRSTSPVSRTARKCARPYSVTARLTRPSPTAPIIPRCSDAARCRRARSQLSYLSLRSSAPGSTRSPQTVIDSFAGRWSWLVAAFVIPFALALAISFAMYDAPPAPRINVRWSNAVVPAQREALEAAYQLADPAFEGGRTWSYALLDSSTGNLRRLVREPAAEDTYGVDRNDFTLSDPPPAPLFLIVRMLSIASAFGFAGVALLIWFRLGGARRATDAADSDLPRRSRSRPLPFHMLLIAAYPVLQLLGYNVEEVPLQHAIAPLVLSVGAGLIVAAVAWPVVRSLPGSAIVASLTVPLLMFFEPIRDLLANLIPGLGRGAVLAGLGAVLYAGVLWGVRALQSAAIDTLTRVLNVFAITIVSLAVFPILRFHAWDPPAGDSVEIPPRLEAESWSCQVGYCPDIYYLVLDGYGRADALQTAYGIDNEPFLSALRARGFLVAQRSTANYSSTEPALRSALNMDYEHAPQDDISALRIDVNLVSLLLRNRGYDYVLVPSGLPVTSASPLADVTIDAGATQSELAARTLERSILAGFIQSSRQETNSLLGDGVASLDGARLWQRHIRNSLQAIGDIPAGDRPKFVFAHVLSPHPPYVFDRNGDVPPGTQMIDLADLEGANIWNSPNFAGQLHYLNRLVLDLVNRIQARATRPPIVVISGDHGTARFDEVGSRYDPSDRLLAERMTILLAVSAPPEVRSQFYAEITPVNIFRALFRGLFDAPLPRLDDRNYWSGITPPRDVTGVVRTPASAREGARAGQ
jgi:hypothetical protein